MTDEKKPSCRYCHATGDLRPYGPKGSWVCFPCATSTPERNEEAKKQFLQQLDEAFDRSDSGVVIMDGSNGELFPMTDDGDGVGTKKKEDEK